MKDNLEIVGTVKLGGTGHNHYWTYYISPEGRLFKVKSKDGMMSEVNIALTSTNKYKGKSYVATMQHLLIAYQISISIEW